jgi:hypothetical protein
MQGQSKTGSTRAVAEAAPARGSDADIYRRYAVGLYRQALLERCGIRPRDLVALVAAPLRRLTGGQYGHWPPPRARRTTGEK